MASSVERQALILKNLHTNGKVVVAELRDLLQVSEVTVRSDLEQLSQKGMLVRTHGGAVKSDLLVHDIPLYEKTTKHQNEKERIATVAAALVEDGEVITIDSGSTTWELARRLKSKRRLTIITNSLPIAGELSTVPGIEVIVTGGSVRRDSLSIVGPHTEELLREHFASKLFLGVDAFDVNSGLTTPNLHEARVNRVMIDMAREVIVVADSSKFGRRSMCLICETKRIHKVVTDRGIPKTDLDHLQAVGVEVILA
jgi:DeoR family transcriptional regulator of aga operon